MLADVLAGESPAGGNCPVATVVISGGRNGDGPAGSPEVKVSVGLVRRGAPTRELKGQWVIRPRRVVSDPPERQATRQVVAEANQRSPEIGAHLKRMVGGIGNAESVRERRRPAPSVCEELGRCSRWGPRGHRGRHAETEQPAKARNHSLVAKAGRHSEGNAYKPQSGEMALCRRVGRMGSIKR